MRRIAAGVMALVMSWGLVGCGTSSGVAEDMGGAESFPIVGMWQEEGSPNMYWRVAEGGTVTFEAVLTNTSTMTVNGVTSSSTSKRVSAYSDTWEVQGENFLYNKVTPYKMTVDGSEYKLVGEKKTYVRVGEVDYEIDLGDSSDGEQSAAVAEPYPIGDTVFAGGVELTLTEVGFSDDIRIKSKTSGISITSGPTPEVDKQFFYLRGTVKNTGTQAVRPAIGGGVTLDGYEYDIRVDTIDEDGTPCSQIDPLDSVHILIFAHIPVELVDSFQTGKMTFGFNDGFETVDITNCDHLYFVDAVR